MYLVRRVKRLLTDYNAGRLRFASAEVEAELVPKLKAVQFDEEGEPLLETVAPEVRSFARAFALVADQREASEPSPRGEPEPVTQAQLATLMRQLFSAMERVFVAFMETSPEALRRSGRDFHPALMQVLQNRKGKPDHWSNEYNTAVSELTGFYSAHAGEIFRGARALPGFQLVQGGSQSFTATHLRAARSMLLYTDTLLIPDPVARWLESDNRAERFVIPRLLEEIFHLHPLKPLVDANLPYPAVVVFPSFEKALEEREQFTQDQQELMLLGFFGHYLGERFDDVQELVDFAAKNETSFLEKCDRHRLFIGVGCKPETPLRKALEQTLSEYRRTRSVEFMDMVNGLPPAVQVFNAIAERLSPQYHLQENARETGASPLYTLPVHWHYAKLLGAVAQGEDR